MSKKYWLISLFATLLWLLTGASAFAEQKGDTMTINFTGYLANMRPCKINNDQIINVSFGKVSLNAVATDHISQPLNYTLNCPGAREGYDTIVLTILATPVPGDTAAIASSKPGLWFKFMNNGQPQNLNESFGGFKYGQTPTPLIIELEKDPSVELTAGTFTGSATFVADYF